MITNIKIILTSIGGLIAAAFYIFNKGKQNERNKSFKRAVKVVKEIKKRRSNRSNDDISIVNERLRNGARDK